MTHFRPVHEVGGKLCREPMTSYRNMPPKASGREYQLVNHRRIDDAQPLLLSVGDEQPAKKLHAVDIDTVFIVGAAAYRISRRQFIGWSNAGKCRQHRLDAPTRYIGRMSVGIGIDLLHRAELLLVLSNLHLTQLARGLLSFMLTARSLPRTFTSLRSPSR